MLLLPGKYCSQRCGRQDERKPGDACQIQHQTENTFVGHRRSAQMIMTTFDDSVNGILGYTQHEDEDRSPCRPEINTSISEDFISQTNSLNFHELLALKRSEREHSEQQSADSH